MKNLVPFPGLFPNYFSYLIKIHVPNRVSHSEDLHHEKPPKFYPISDSHQQIRYPNFDANRSTDLIQKHIDLNSQPKTKKKNF